MCELEPLKEDCFAEPTCQWHQERKPEYTQDNLLFKRQQTHRACGRALRPSKTHVHRIFCARSTKLTNSFIHQAVRELNSLPGFLCPPQTLWTLNLQTFFLHNYSIYYIFCTITIYHTIYILLLLLALMFFCCIILLQLQKPFATTFLNMHMHSRHICYCLFLGLENVLIFCTLCLLCLVFICCACALSLSQWDSEKRTFDYFVCLVYLKKLTIKLNLSCLNVIDKERCRNGLDHPLPKERR